MTSPVDQRPTPEEATSLAYLTSEQAERSLAADPYWPKWDSPWWHALLLRERGMASQIDTNFGPKLASTVAARVLPYFPLHEAQLQPGIDGHRHIACHCQIGSLIVTLDALGVDPDAALPWARAFFTSAQMADGGLNCDDTAYLVDGETPSSMVATIAAFEALLVLDARRSDAVVRACLARAAHFLIERRLVEGSSSRHNAEERAEARAWKDLTFPRFYFYDVLRGLSALTTWAERFREPMPSASIAEAVAAVEARAPDGLVRVGRRAWDGSRSLCLENDGTWTRGHAASSFTLLEASGEVGAPCNALTAEWIATRARLAFLKAEGLIV